MSKVEAPLGLLVDETKVGFLPEAFAGEVLGHWVLRGLPQIPVTLVANEPLPKPPCLQVKLFQKNSVLFERTNPERVLPRAQRVA